MAKNNKRFYGSFGGQYAPELLMYALNNLEAAMDKHLESEEFQAAYKKILKDYSGRPHTTLFC